MKKYWFFVAFTTAFFIFYEYDKFTINITKDLIY